MPISELGIWNEATVPTEQKCYSAGFVSSGGHPLHAYLSLTNLNLPPRLLSQVQNVVIINTCSIGRKFIIDEGH